MWRVDLRLKAFRKHLTLIELNRRLICVIKETEPLDMKVVNDELLLSSRL